LDPIWNLPIHLSQAWSQGSSPPRCRHGPWRAIGDDVWPPLVMTTELVDYYVGWGLGSWGCNCGFVSDRRVESVSKLGQWRFGV